MEEVLKYFNFNISKEKGKRTGSEIELENFETCQICIEKYDNKERPRVVLSNCGHVTCDKCAENIIKASPFAVSGTGACPTCNAHFSRHQIFKVII